MMSDTPTHEECVAVVRYLVSDYKGYGGGRIERWKNNNEAYPDCSHGCKHAAWLEGPLGSDWCVCTNPISPRMGLLRYSGADGTSQKRSYSAFSIWGSAQFKLGAAAIDSFVRPISHRPR